ncbi:flagellar assembly protein A [Salipaludibacillus sp. CF4.18]|uniref:DUF342 domain-containing protein n=1 Tax=Salipaludibacillus sp. CF4.18 TaxID=3373081 RepID=UPI003EE5874A
MTQSLVFQGKNRDSVVKKALYELQLQEDDVEIKVIDSGSNRLFGLSKSKVKIEVVIKEKNSEIPEKELNWEELLKQEIHDQSTPSTHATANISQVNLLGKAWIKDGNLYFKDSDTAKPIIEPTESLQVKKNGEIIKEKTFLSQGDSITFELTPKTVETAWSLKVNQETQTVILSIKPGYYLIPYIPDHPPNEKITLLPKERKQPNNQLMEEDVFEQLAKMKVIHGIETNKIKEACSTLEEKTFVIAEGLLPKHGKHGEVNFTIDTKEKKLNFAENVDGTMDFRESIYIPSIEEGQLLGTVDEPTGGEDGITIYGDVMKAKPGKAVTLKVGSGVSYLEEENKLISTENGRPKIEKLGQLVRVSVLPKLLHHGDLNLEHGNIHFVGDVEITGHVNEQMTVDAEGSAFIHRSVLHSIIQTRNSITVAGNAISSSLIAGKNSLVFDQMYTQLEPFILEFHQFQTMLKQLVKSPHYQQIKPNSQGLGPAIRVLMETKFKDFSLKCKAMISLINDKQNLLDRRWQTFAGKIYKGLLVYHTNAFNNLSDLETFSDEVYELLDICQSPSNSVSTIKLLYTMNSDIHCNGDVQIAGKGSIHSKIHADGEVTIKGKLMGGYIFGKKGVRIENAGSESGVKTVIEVPEDQTIEIKQAYTDVFLRIGQKQLKLTDTKTNIKAYLNNDHQIVLY